MHPDSDALSCVSPTANVPSALCGGKGVWRSGLHQKPLSESKERRKLRRAAHLASVRVTGLLRVGISIEIQRLLKNRLQNQRGGENYVARLTLRRYVSQVCCASAFPLKFEDSSKIECKIKGEAKIISRGSPCVGMCRKSAARRHFY